MRTRTTTSPGAVRLAPLLATGTFLVAGAAATIALSQGPSKASPKSPGDGAIQCQFIAIDEVKLPAREQGQLLEFSREIAGEGKLVQKGQVVGKIDDSDLLARKMVAEAQVRRAESDASSDNEYRAAQKTSELAKKEWEKSKLLNERTPNIVTTQEVERQKLTYEKAVFEAKEAYRKLNEVAKFAVEEKKAELGIIEAQIERRKVVAPLTGVVTERSKHEGEWVQPGETIATIVRMDRVRVKANLETAKFSPAQVLGRKATVTLQSPGMSPITQAGVIEHVDATVSPGSSRFVVWFEVENKFVDGFWTFRPGLPAELEIDMKSPPVRAPAAPASKGAKKSAFGDDADGAVETARETEEPPAPRPVKRKS